MLDFDCAADYSNFEVTIKFGQHKQLPLVLAGVNARDEEEARCAAASAIAQYENQGVSGHAPTCCRDHS